MTNTKPDWLVALEAQSWQAELVASGLAIYGSISLGSYLDFLVEWCAITLNDRVLQVLYLSFVYLFIAHAVLVVSFIVHLGLRILWVGIVGLSSVYPQGINTDSDVYNPVFMNKLKSEFPDLAGYSLKLDGFCSLIFSILCAMVVVLATFSLWILFYILLSELLIQFIPVHIIQYFGLSMVALFILFSIVVSFTVQGKFKDKPFAKKYGYAIYRVFGKTLYFLGYTPFSYIVQTLRTNLTSKMYFMASGVIFMMSMVVIIPRLKTLPIYFSADGFVKYYDFAYKATEQNYLETLEKDIILEPFIQTKSIEVPYLDLFIPFAGREKKVMLTTCGTYKWQDDWTRAENLSKRDAFRSNCANQYYQLFIDQKEQTNVSFYYFRNYRNSGPGYQATIGLDSLSPGRHILRIKSAYSDQEGNNYQREIPFFKVGI